MASTSQPRTAITNVKVFDGDRISELRTVVIDGAFIGTDATDAHEIDGRGSILLPGLIDAHVHVQKVWELELLAQSGVTTALDMGFCPQELVDTVRKQAGLTDIRTAGISATSSTSLHKRMLGFPDAAVIETPEKASQWVYDRISEGSHYIKLIVDNPGPSQETVNALAAAAHQQGKICVAHAARFAAYAMAQEAKVDIITHIPQDKALDEAGASLMASEGRICVPTLSQTEAFGRAGMYANDPNKPGRASVAAMYSSGVTILAGTDAHSFTFDPFRNPLGESLHRELELLVVAGLSTIDALRAATSLPAKHFGLSDRGIIAPGHRADLVLIADDPIADISATRSIQRVWCGGMEISIPPVTLLRGMRSRVSRIMASVGIFGFRIVMNIARMCGVLPKGLSH